MEYIFFIKFIRFFKPASGETCINERKFFQANKDACRINVVEES